MKKIFLSALLLSSPALSWDVPPIPSLQEQYEQARIDEVVSIFAADPYFAGKSVDIQMFGKRVAVDRKGEAPVPGASPKGGLASLTEVLDGLDAGAKGKVDIEVNREWYENGALRLEKWHIVINGQYNIKKEALTPPKEEKGTGEAQ